MLQRAYELTVREDMASSEILRHGKIWSLFSTYVSVVIDTL